MQFKPMKLFKKIFSCKKRKNHS